MSRRFAFGLLGYGAGTLGVLAWGWLAGAVFLLAGGGIGGDYEEPILPFMLTWASVLAGPGLALVIALRVVDRPLSQRAPWSWMSLTVLAAAALCLLGWGAVWLG